MASKKRSGGEFQRLTQVEHVLLRPEVYLGSNEPVPKEGILVDKELSRVARTWEISPLFMKTFSEILVNAIDASVRDSTMRKLEVTLSEGGEITVENDGAGIPIVPFVDKDGSETSQMVPEVIFGSLQAGSNFDDSKRRFVGGLNGVGSSCTAIWSKRFAVHVEDGERSFYQVYEDNLSQRTEALVVPLKAGQRGGGTRTGRVKIVYLPDYERMHINPSCTPVLEDLLRTQCVEAAVCIRPGVNVFFNGAKLSNKLSKFAEELFHGGDVIFTEQLGCSSCAEAGPRLS